MDAKLIVTAGPLKGTIVPLTAPQISIGRGKSNQVCLKSVNVSRKHCVIRREAGDRFSIADMGRARASE